MKKEDIGKVSVIVSTYNRCEALQICLLSLFRQTVLPDEVIVGDDGSTEETALLIAKLQKEAPFPIIHLWHEDKFMYNKAKNPHRMEMLDEKNVRC